MDWRASLGHSSIQVSVSWVGRDGAGADKVLIAESEQVPLTTYVVADFDSEESRELVKEALLSVVRAITPNT